MGRKASYGFAVCLLGMAVVSLLVPLPNQYRSLWLTKLFDLGHVPLFALVTLCFWWVVRQKTWLAFGLASVLAVVAEVGQAFTGRSADILDVVRGLLGALIGVVFLQVFTGPFQWRRLAVGLGMAVALAAWPVWDCGPVLLDAYAAYRSFPVLSDFQSRSAVTRWSTSGARLEREAATPPGPSWVGKLEVSPHPGGSGAILFPIIADWSGYRRLYCTFSFTGQPLRILISVRDGKPVRPPHKRFDLERRYRAGRHCVRIDLQDLAAGTHFAPLDLSRIQSFHFVVTDVTEPRKVLLDQIYLE